MWFARSVLFWINLITVVIIVLTQVVDFIPLPEEIKPYLFLAIAILNVVLRFLRGELPYFLSANHAAEWRRQRGIDA